SLGQSKLFPPMAIHLIGSGESSGELDRMLERAATHQESEMDSLIGTMLSVLEPALIIGMGLIVLAIVMAILLPIFQINQLVGCAFPLLLSLRRGARSRRCVFRTPTTCVLSLV